MLRHVTLLGILWRLWGALWLLVGASLLLLAGGALGPALDPEAASVPVMAGLTAIAFAIAGGVALIWGGAHLWAGRLVMKRTPLGRMVSLALAVVNLLLLPFGTALGAYALWVLLKDEARRLFAQSPHASAAASPS